MAVNNVAYDLHEAISQWIILLLAKLNYEFVIEKENVVVKASIETIKIYELSLPREVVTA